MKHRVAGNFVMLITLGCWLNPPLVPAGYADCTLTNTSVTPLNDLGSGVYKGFAGGLYPNGANRRPPAHEAAGLRIATNDIKPLNASGNVDTNNGKIVVLSSGMSNTTQEWASKGADNFLRLATNDPSLNPRVKIVDGAIGGMDAIQWTNLNSPNWNTVITQRLVQAGVTTNQVHVLWLKQALASPVNYGIFPGHAQALQSHLAMILRNARDKFPNLKLAYLSCRTRAYVSGPSGLNPEPFAFETGFADKWVIEDQIVGRNNLNYDPAQGAVVAPWISWGPYIWADGTVPRSDSFTWLCSDLESADYTHPSATGGVPKVARQLLAFFKNDPTTTPWFLKKTLTPPIVSISASTNNGIVPLTVNFTASASSSQGAITNHTWTFEDGCFSLAQNPTKTFPAPGAHNVRLSVGDTVGNTALTSMAVNISPLPFQITSVAKEGNGLRLAWTTRGGENYVVQGAATLSGSGSNNFTDISPLIAAPSAAASATNYLDAGPLSKRPPRYYQIRLGP
jgi:hypothetical protein